LIFRCVPRNWWVLIKLCHGNETAFLVFHTLFLTESPQNKPKSPSTSFLILSLSLSHSFGLESWKLQSFAFFISLNIWFLVEILHLFTFLKVCFLVCVLWQFLIGWEWILNSHTTYPLFSYFVTSDHCKVLLFLGFEFCHFHPEILQGVFDVGIIISHRLWFWGFLSF